MARYKILYWYDIPSMVRAVDTNGRVSLQLHNRFQLAIDEVAMKVKLVGEDAYTEGFKWSEEQEQDGSAEEVAQAIVARLELQYPEIDIQAQAHKLRHLHKG